MIGARKRGRRVRFAQFFSVEEEWTLSKYPRQLLVEINAPKFTGGGGLIVLRLLSCFAQWFVYLCYFWLPCEVHGTRALGSAGCCLLGETSLKKKSSWLANSVFPVWSLTSWVQRDIGTKIVACVVCCTVVFSVTLAAVLPLLFGCSCACSRCPLPLSFFLVPLFFQQTDMPKICASVVDREKPLDDGFKLLINNFAGIDG